MNPRCQDFKVGDIVFVREWEDMENEFGVDSYGDIPTDRYNDDEDCCMNFVPGMRQFCGRECRIEQIDAEGWYRLDLGDEGDYYRFSDAMLNQAAEKEIECNNDLLDFLSNL